MVFYYFFYKLLFFFSVVSFVMPGYFNFGLLLCFGLYMTVFSYEWLNRNLSYFLDYCHNVSMFHICLVSFNNVLRAVLMFYDPMLAIGKTFSKMRKVYGMLYIVYHCFC